MVFLMEYECTAAFRSSPSSLFCVSCSYSASLEKKLGSGSTLPATETSFLSFANKTLAYPSCPISLSNHPLYLKKTLTCCTATTPHSLTWIFSFFTKGGKFSSVKQNQGFQVTYHYLCLILIKLELSHHLYFIPE